MISCRILAKLRFNHIKRAVGLIRPKDPQSDWPRYQVSNLKSGRIGLLVNKQNIQAVDLAQHILAIANAPKLKL